MGVVVVVDWGGVVVVGVDALEASVVVVVVVVVVLLVSGVGVPEREQYPKYTPDARSVWPATERPEMGMLAVGMPSWDLGQLLLVYCLLANARAR